MNGSEAAGDLVLIRKSRHCFYHVNRVAVMPTSPHLDKKSKASSPAASLSAISQVTKPQL